LARLDDIRWCPVQFQALVPGADVRIHVVDREVFPTEIVSDMVDYRYARRNGCSAELRAVELAPDVAEQCIALTRRRGFTFAGIDLKITPDGEILCLEVDPGQSLPRLLVLRGQYRSAYCPRGSALP
jgi:hypothetical protein